jgi:PAS domain S-box-containing protein
MLKTLLPGLALFVAACWALAGLAIYQVAWNAPEIARSREQVLSAFELMATARSLERAIRDAERSERNFVVVGDASSSLDYAAIGRAIATRIADLKILAGDDQMQRQRIQRLELLAEAELAALGQLAEVRRGAGKEAAFAALQRYIAAGSLQSLASQIDDLVAVESAYQSWPRARVERGEARSAGVATAAGVLAFVVMVLGVIQMLGALQTMSQAEESRRQSEEQLRAMIDGVSDYAIYRLDPEGRVVNWNAGAERIKGYAADEIIGKRFSAFFTEEDRAAGVPQKALQTAAREGKYIADGWRVRKGGERFWANVVINALYDRDGGLVGFAKVTRDATELRLQQEALERTREALVQSQKMEALGQLTGGVAHDFNNLLTVILGGIDMVDRRLRAGDTDVTRMLETARRGANRGALLTRRLLAFARRQPLEPTVLEPNRLLSGLGELLRMTMGEGVSIETVLGAGVWRINADATQLESAILNLAVNARDAMPSGGKLTLETANTRLDEAYAAGQQELAPGEYVMIAVSDTGHGMSREVADRAFEPFFTTKDSGQGTGLGLSQVYGFVRQSHGHARIYSEPGRGTTVKLYFPRHDAPVQSETPAPAAPAGAARETILVVEDDGDVRAYAKEALAEIGYRVLEAADAQHALQTLEDEPGVDLLLTDVGLPGGMDGRQLSDRARAQKPELKTLYTTGYARNAIVHHDQLDADVELITKPFTQAELARRVRRVLDHAPV